MAYIQRNVSKKTGKTINWKITVLLGRNEDGKQVRLTKRVAPYDDMTPKKEEQRIQREADAWEAKEKAEYQKQKEKERDTTSKLQVKRERDRITLTDFIDNKWMKNDILRGPKPKTPDSIAFYENMGNHIKAYWKDTKLSQIDKEDVLDFLRYLQYDARTKGGKEYGQTTKYHIFATLRTIMGYARYLEYIDRNPCEDIRDQDKPGRSHKTQGFLDTEGYNDFVAKLDSEEEVKHWKGRIYSHLYFKCMAIVFINVGLRRGELCGLQWQDIEEYCEGGGSFILRRNVSLVTVDPSENEDGRKTDIHIGPLKCRKDGEYRRVYFGNPILTLLKSLRKEQEDKIGGKLLNNAYIFSRANDPYQPLFPTTPTRMIALFIKRHNLPDLSPHDLRRTSLSVYAEQGATIKELQNKAGHSDSRTSQEIYIMVSERMQRTTANRIDNELLSSVKIPKQA